VTVPPEHEARVGVSEKRSDGVRRKAGRERVRGECVAAVVQAWPGLCDLGREASSPKGAVCRDRGECGAVGSGEDERAIWRAPARKAVTAQPERIFGRERHVTPARAGLRSEQRIDAVGVADAIEAGADADDAGVEVEPIGSPGECDQLAGPESGAEREGDQRRCEAAPEAHIIRRSGADDRVRFLRREDARGLLAVSIRRNAHSSTWVRLELSVPEGHAQRDTKGRERLATVLRRAVGGDRVHEPLNVARRQGGDRHATDSREYEKA
jgi:hypothetical protein